MSPFASSQFVLFTGFRARAVPFAFCVLGVTLELDAQRTWKYETYPDYLEVLELSLIHI